MNELDDQQLAHEYEKKIKGLFKEKKIKPKTNYKTKSKKTKSKNPFFGGKKSHKNRTRKHRK